jgi:hypothetical protein
MWFVWGLGSWSPAPGTPVLAMPLPQPLTRPTNPPAAGVANDRPIEQIEPPAQVADLATDSTSESPIVVLSAEPSMTGQRSDPEIPVELPGYVLPDDSFEESAHEGS